MENLKAALMSQNGTTFERRVLRLDEWQSIPVALAPVLTAMALQFVLCWILLRRVQTRLNPRFVEAALKNWEASILMMLVGVGLAFPQGQKERYAGMETSWLNFIVLSNE